MNSLCYTRGVRRTTAGLSTGHPALRWLLSCPSAPPLGEDRYPLCQRYKQIVPGTAIWHTCDGQHLFHVPGIHRQEGHKEQLCQPRLLLEMSSSHRSQVPNPGELPPVPFPFPYSYSCDRLLTIARVAKVQSWPRPARGSRDKPPSATGREGDQGGEVICVSHSREGRVQVLGSDGRVKPMMESEWKL